MSKTKRLIIPIDIKNGYKLKSITYCPDRFNKEYECVIRFEKDE